MTNTLTVTIGSDGTLTSSPTNQIDGHGIYTHHNDPAHKTAHIYDQIVLQSADGAGLSGFTWTHNRHREKMTVVNDSTNNTYTISNSAHYGANASFTVNHKASGVLIDPSILNEDPPTGGGIPPNRK